MTKRATIKDIAKVANVSVATVSNVINGIDKVSTEVKERILRIMTELDYHVNLQARGLSKQCSEMIGLILPITDEGPDSLSLLLRDNPFYGEFLSAVEFQAAELGYDVLIKGLRAGESCRDWVLKRNLDGAIFLGNFPEILANELQNIGKRLVLVDCYPREPLDLSTIRIDDQEGGYLATKHLLEYGHRQIAIAASNVELEGPIKRRYLGYKQALKEYGVRASKKLLLLDDLSFEGGYRIGKEIIKEKSATAVFAVGDIVAFGILRAVQEAGFKVPDDLSIVGFDNVKNCEYSQPALTSISQPVFERGCLAVQALVTAISEQEAATQSLTLPVSLEIRNSVRPLQTFTD